MAAPARVSPDSRSLGGAAAPVTAARVGLTAARPAAATASMLQRGAQFLPARRLQSSKHAGSGSPEAGPARATTTARESGRQPLA